jgi:hypothetical protein
MSYCRWSSDNWQSDVYVYESDCGWQTHVAGMKRISDTPCPALPGVDDIDVFMAAHAMQMAWVEQSKLVPIGLPHDNESFIDCCPGDCAERLELLKGLGYHVPQYAIDSLRAEATGE